MMEVRLGLHMGAWQRARNTVAWWRDAAGWACTDSTAACGGKCMIEQRRGGGREIFQRNVEDVEPRHRGRR